MVKLGVGPPEERFTIGTTCTDWIAGTVGAPTGVSSAIGPEAPQETCSVKVCVLAGPIDSCSTSVRR